MNEKAKLKEVNVNQENRIERLRLAFSGLYDLLDTECKSSRETSLAFTKLEEAQFWAIKGISREENNNEE